MEIWKNPENIIFWFSIILLIFLILLFFIVIILKVSYKKSIEKKQLFFNQQIEHEKKLNEAIIQVQDQERKEIASELHDQISNKLNLIILNINNLKELKTNHINEIKEDIRKVIIKNRDISHYLFPVEIENIGILLTLQDLSIKYSSEKFKIILNFDSDIKFKNKQTEIQLYRVIQESLTNTLKYSNSNEFSITLRKFKKQIFVMISDNGIGFELEEIKKGIGLTGIETRLNAIHAAYKIKSKPNKGTQLIIVI